MRPTTAVIFAAGTGSRMLPITAAVQKELLPVLNRPIIDYTVADLIAAGITRVIFVIRPGQTGLKDYYLGNANLEAALSRLGKTDALAALNQIHAQATYEFIEQPDTAGYGTAIPLRIALDHLVGEGPIVVSAGDDAIWRANHTSEMSDFMADFVSSKADGAIMGLAMNSAELAHYGLLVTKSQHGRMYLENLLEKPTAGTTTSTLANISKYILTESTRDFVKNLQPDPKTGEYYLTDAITAAAQHHQIAVYQGRGSYLDTGTPASWLAANELVAQASQE